MHRQLIDRVIEDLVDTMNVSTRQLKREPAYGNVDWDRLEYMIELTNPYDEEKIKSMKKMKKIEEKEEKKKEKEAKKIAKLKRKKIGGGGVGGGVGVDVDANENRLTVSAKNIQNLNANNEDEDYMGAGGGGGGVGGDRARGGRDGRVDWHAIPLCTILSKGPNPKTLVTCELQPRVAGGGGGGGGKGKAGGRGTLGLPAPPPRRRSSRYSPEMNYYTFLSATE